MRGRPRISPSGTGPILDFITDTTQAPLGEQHAPAHPPFAPSDQLTLHGGAVILVRNVSSFLFDDQASRIFVSIEKRAIGSILKAIPDIVKARLKSPDTSGKYHLDDNVARVLSLQYPFSRQYDDDTLLGPVDDFRYKVLLFDGRPAKHRKKKDDPKTNPDAGGTTKRHKDDEELTKGKR